MKELIYASCPARMGDQKEEIMDFIASEGKGALHPFNALPYQYFEGGVIGRDKSLKYCCRLIDICDEFWLFGLSEGTLIETEYHFRRNSRLSLPQPRRILVKQWDREWETYRKLYMPRFEDTLIRLNLIS